MDRYRVKKSGVLTYGLEGNKCYITLGTQHKNIWETDGIIRDGVIRLRKGNITMGVDINHLLEFFEKVE